MPGVVVANVIFFLRPMLAAFRDQYYRHAFSGQCWLLSVWLSVAKPGCFLRPMLACFLACFLQPILAAFSGKCRVALSGQYWLSSDCFQWPMTGTFQVDLKRQLMFSVEIAVALVFVGLYIVWCCWCPITVPAAFLIHFGFVFNCCIYIHVYYNFLF